MKRAFHISVIAIAMFLCAACHKNGPVVYDGPFFIWFDPSKSGSTTINAMGVLNQEYVFHYTGTERKKAFQVNFTVTPGDGLVEDVDYMVINTKTYLTFNPGEYSAAVRIRWLSHEIDESKNNSLVISLTGCSEPDIIMGFPGPDQKNKDVKITKYSDE